jgi:signal transduction histidine kinase
VLTVPLPNGHVVSVVVPPRRTLSGITGISLFLGNPVQSPTRLNLVPALDAGPGSAAVVWTRNPEGWRSRKLVDYPEGTYYAHLLVPTPPAGVWLARAALIIAFDLAVLMLLWALGMIARGASPLPANAWSAWWGSFRARVTLALFGFFLLPTIAFGYVAYRALAQEVERATAGVAARAARQAVTEFDAARGDLGALASHAGADVLRYQYGELLDVSSPEALDLGVYGAWMPPATYRMLRSGEEAASINVQPFGEQRFVTAYHSLFPSGTLAVPMTLVSGDTAIRQRQLSHLILFALLIGALLTLALSVAVARALAGPIAQLRRAAALVGAGRLRVHLPEDQPGEFGQLFTSFNRMTRRLRRARGRELRSARVLAWGEMARQVAHEIKNPLTPIKLSVQHLRRAYRDRHPQFATVLEGSVQEILREIDRLSEIARAFSRYGAPALAAGPLEAVDVGTIVREALTLYRTSDEPIRYESVLDPGLPRVHARSGELKEVLLNLLENARAALDRDGSITVSARSEGDEVTLEVQDDGSGIPRELQERVFEPHFSTRSSGTGLGLAIVRRLVESWGGKVSVESGPGRGTRVRVRLQAAPPASAVPGISGSDS